MKQVLTFILALSLLLSACSAAPSNPEQTEPLAETSSIPSSTPTLSEEDVFLHSLPEGVHQAYELGLCDVALLKELDRTCTLRESADILQIIYQKRFNSNSWMIAHSITEEYATLDTTRGWFITMMYAADAEALVGVSSEDYETNLRSLTCTTNALTNEIADVLLGLVGNTGYVMVDTGNKQPERHISAYGEFSGAAAYVNDLSDYEGDIVCVSYALSRYDRRNGEKLMTWDQDKNLRFKDSMSVRDVLETAVRYYYALEPAPNMILHEDTLPYDKSIITPELLNKETDLPEASCHTLPAQWHGIDLYNNVGLDEKIYKYELQAIKDAGFNFIRYVFDNTYYHGRSIDKERMNENRLKELDQLLAWCMELDIHLNLSVSWSYDWPDGFSDTEYIGSPSNAEGLGKFWTALAKRYEGIPNHYLSFTLLNYCWGENDEKAGAFYGYMADMIRQEDPTRCLIARVGLYGITGKDIASHGIALSSENTHGQNFYFPYSKLEQAKSLMEAASWPYTEDGKTVDAESNMTIAYKDQWSWYPHIAPDEVAAVAKANNVGFMIYRWGPRNMDNIPIAESDRYSDETMKAYLTDMSETMEQRGYGWCYTEMMSSLGIGFLYPLVETTTYTQVENYSLYLDNEMLSWFREINQLK